MLTPYAQRLLERHAARLADDQVTGWKPVSGSGVRKPAVKLVYAPRKAAPVWLVRVRGRVVFEHADKQQALTQRDRLLNQEP